MTGRPNKLTEMRREVIVAAVRRGCRLGRAAAEARIGRSTLMEWLRRGRVALEAADTTGEPIPEKERLFAELHRDVDAAWKEWWDDYLESFARGGES
jgi:transposase